ncbi:DUF3558 domain-containing protein [Nocardia testacea]|uniref:DUF3558 domain-containing protein n=1 Tax=Nocardia testacea TaxID=248551 RepID=UPI0033C5BE42
MDASSPTRWTAANPSCSPSAPIAGSARITRATSDRYCRLTPRDRSAASEDDHRHPPAELLPRRPGHTDRTTLGCNGSRSAASDLEYSPPTGTEYEPSTSRAPRDRHGILCHDHRFLVIVCARGAGGCVDVRGFGNEDGFGCRLSGGDCAGTRRVFRWFRRPGGDGGGSGGDRLADSVRGSSRLRAGEYPTGAVSVTSSDLTLDDIRKNSGHEVFGSDPIGGREALLYRTPANTGACSAAVASTDGIFRVGIMALPAGQVQAPAPCDEIRRVTEILTESLGTG